MTVPQQEARYSLYEGTQLGQDADVVVVVVVVEDVVVVVVGVKQPHSASQAVTTTHGS